MVEFLQNPERLRRKLSRLLDDQKHRRLDLAGTEALAECCFRISVHCDTPACEAVQLLHRAHRVDGANPRYAFLLARHYFTCGELDRAAVWLETAVRLCPTSHRVWTHVALLQRELNERYRGNAKFDPDDLRERSARVLLLVREGVDRFDGDLRIFEPRSSTVSQEARARAEDAPFDSRKATALEPSRPPPSDEAPFGRSTRADCCRWSGAVDLALEAMLEAQPSELTRTRALPLLRQIARTAHRRRGGTSAFAIAAIQWCLAGHSLETVIRLRRIFLPSRRNPSLDLLDLVCRLLQVDEREVAALLAGSLKEKQLPHLLAALVHHRRLLWQSLEFNATGKHRTARRFLATTQGERTAQQDKHLDGRAKALARSIDQAAMAFAPKPRAPAAVADALPPIDVSEAFTYLAALEAQLATLARVHEQVVHSLEEVVSRSANDLSALDEFAKVFEDAAERGSSSLDELCIRSHDQGDRMPRDFEDRVLCARNRLNELLYGLQLKRLRRALAARLEPADQAAAVSGSALAEALVQPLKVLLDLFSDPVKDHFTTAEIPAAQVARLQREADALDKRLQAELDTLRKHDAEREEGVMEQAALAECAAIATFLNSVPETVTLALRKLEELRASNKNHDQAMVGSLDKAAAAYRNISPQVGPLRRKLRKLLPSVTSSPSVMTAPPAPTADTGHIPPGAPRSANASSPVAQTYAAAASKSPDAPPADGLALLTLALERLEHQINQRFSEALSSFDSYAPHDLFAGPLQALRLSVIGRHAEVLYRLGRPAEAQRLWNAILRKDRLDANAAQNLAVSESLSAGTGRDMAAWRRYAELLYLRDIVAGTPRPRARARAEFHRQYGAAHAPAAFSRLELKETEPAVDEAALVAFLQSPARLRAFVDHRLVEWFNAKLDFTSCTLLLGCGRSEGENARTTAKTKLLAFGESVRPLLPQRVQKAFSAITRKYIEDSRTAATVRRLALFDTKVYSAELERQKKWIEDICNLKRVISMTLVKSQDLPRHMTSLVFLEELVRLDEVPLDLSPALLNAVIRKFGPVDADYFLGLMRRASDRVLGNLVEFLQQEGGSDTEQTLRKRQFDRLVARWLACPLVRASTPVKFLLTKKAQEASKRKAYPDALRLITAAVDMDDRLPALPMNALTLFVEAAGDTKRYDCHAQMAKVIRDWLARAHQRLKEGVKAPADNEDEPLTRENVEQVAHQLHETIVQVFLAPFCPLSEMADLRPVVNALTELLAAYPDVTNAHYHRMIAYWNLASLASQAQNRAETTLHLQAANRDSEVVLDDPAATLEQREQATKIQDEAREALRRM